MPDPGPRQPLSPIQVTPAYTSGGAGDCHVHHGDGVVAVLVGLSNPELAQPLITRLHHDLHGDGSAAWMAASRSEPVAGAVVATVNPDGALDIDWWGRVDVQVTTDYGYETHVGAEEPNRLTVTGSTPVRVMPRATHASSGASLGRGTIVAAGCEIALTPQPTTPDSMVEASSEISTFTSIPVPVPPRGDDAGDGAATPPPGDAPGEPTDPAAPAAGPPPAPEPPAEPASAAFEPTPAAGPDVAGAKRVDLSAPLEVERAPLPTVEDAPDSGGVELVRGLRCRNGHHNHPEARLCSLCGDAMQNVSIFVGRDGVLGELGERPPLGIITLDDGQAYQIGHDTIIGRTPTRDDMSTMVVEFPDDDTMSRAHVAIDLDGWNVFVRDLGSSNGTGVRFPDSETYVRLEPHQRYPLPHNTVLVFGRRWCTFTATSAAPVRLT